MTKLELQMLSKNFNLEKYVKFTGFVEDSLKTMYYGAADIFCLSSTMRTESFGIVNLEALGAGIPYIASDILPIREVTKGGIRGISYDPKNYEELAHSLQKLLTDDLYRVELIKDVESLVTEYDWEKLAEGIENNL